MDSQVTDMQAIVDRYLRGDASGPVIMMELLQITEDVDFLSRALPSLDGAASRLSELARYLDDNEAGCRTIVKMIRQRLDSAEAAENIDIGIERCRTLFEASVTASEESSVALYSLGNSTLLRAATREVIDVMEHWDVLRHDRDALEIGCGIGRLMEPLSARLHSVSGVDISARMIRAARRRLENSANANVQIATGRDLSQFGSGSMDLVYSVDTFPYLVLSGRALVECHFHEIHRVLRAGGHFVLFNYAYGLTREEANTEVLALAFKSAFEVLRANESPFRLWNGIGWLMRRS